MTMYNLLSAKDIRITALETQVKNLNAEIAKHKAAIQNKREKLGACGSIIFAYCTLLWMSVKVAEAAGQGWIWMWLLFSCVMTVCLAAMMSVVLHETEIVGEREYERDG